MPEPDFLTLLAQVSERYGVFRDEIEGLRAQTEELRSQAQRYEVLETSLRFHGVPAEAVQTFFDDVDSRRQLAETILRFYRFHNEQMRRHEEERARREEERRRSESERAKELADIRQKEEALAAAKRAETKRRAAERVLDSLVRNERYRLLVDYRDLPADLTLCCSKLFEEETELRRIPASEWTHRRCVEGEVPAEIEFALLVFREDEEDTGVINTRAYRLGLRLATLKESRAFLLANPDDVANRMVIVSNGPCVAVKTSCRYYTLGSHLLLNPREEYPSAHAEHAQIERAYLFVKDG